MTPDFTAREPLSRKPVRKIYNGERFGKWTVIGPAKRKYHLQCICDCGHCLAVNQYNLLSGQTTQCIICCRAAWSEKFLGKRFGKWTVVEYLGGSYWRCRCDCGTEKSFRTSYLGKSNSCLKCSMQMKIDKDRLTIIRAAIDAGVSKPSIARVLGISKQRIYQITDQFLSTEGVT